jgi:hypothetical protein
LAALAVTGWYAGSSPGGSPDAPRPIADLWRYATGLRRAAVLQLEAACDVCPGDPIFTVRGPQQIQRVGEVLQVQADGTGLRAQAMFYASVPPLATDAVLFYHETPDSLGWVLQTLLPPDKQQEISAEIAAAIQAHDKELIALLRPVVVDGLREAWQVAQEDLPAAVARRRAQFEKLAGKYQEQVIQREVVPLVREEILPIVRTRLEPLATGVAREIWQRASLWRFGWRYLYDQSPLPEKQLTQKEWNRFLQEEVSAVLNAHSEEFVKLQTQVLAEVTADPQVQQVVRRSLGRVLEDADVQQLAWEIVREVLVENPRMHEALAGHWRSRKTQAAIQQAAAWFEPVGRRIGQLLLGTPEEGITPEFARVLRNQILLKDRRWLVLQPGTAGPADRAAFPLTMRVQRGGLDPVNPFVILATPQMDTR